MSTTTTPALGALAALSGFSRSLASATTMPPATRHKLAVLGEVGKLGEDLQRRTAGLAPLGKAAATASAKVTRGLCIAAHHHADRVSNGEHVPRAHLRLLARLLTLAARRAQTPAETAEVATAVRLVDALLSRFESNADALAPVTSSLAFALSALLVSWAVRVPAAWLYRTAWLRNTPARLLTPCLIATPGAPFVARLTTA